MAQTHCTTILFLASEPSNAERLRVGQELRDIQERLQLARMREQYSLVQRTAVRPHDITQAILDIEPNIIHFSGHGTSNGELCFEDMSGKLKAVSSEALSSLFELLSEQVTCVILNCCYSAIQAEAIAEHINYVIGMKQEIGDEAAIVFATGFYKALGSGRSIKEAFHFGIVELKLLGIPEHLTPIFLEKNIIKHHWLLEKYDYGLHKDYASFTRNKRRTQQTIVLNPKAYRSIQSILNDLFTYYFSNFYSPYSYGEEWVLISDDQILVPLEWMSDPGSSINSFNSQWSTCTLPSQQNILPGTHWRVLERNKFYDEFTNGLQAIASNNARLIKLLMHSAKARISYQEIGSTHRSLQDFDSQKYRYVCVVVNRWTEMQSSGLVLEDNPESSQKILEWFHH
jgi:CHAT domain